jgi:formylglycine-generating enzyme required for sulfatase activity
MSEQEDIQRQIATLRQDLAAAQNESVRAFIQQQLDAAHRQLNVLLNQVDAPQSNLALGNTVGGDLVQTITIQQFFAGQPAPDERALLDDYLRAVYNDCQSLRLKNLIAKQYDGQERSLLATLTLSDVYTALATDEEIRISRHPRCIILSRLYARLDERSAERVPAERVRSALLAKPNLHDLHDDERVIVGLYRPELALEAIARAPRLVLLGDPGSGKSTALRYLAALLAGAILRGESSLPARGWRDRPLPIPLLCPLGLVAAEVERTGDRPIAALWRVLERRIEGDGARPGLGGYVREAMRRGTVAVLFDGLDEIPILSDGRPLRASIADALRDLARELPEATLVVTCRIRPYRELADWQLREEQGWTERILAPWAFGQVRRFIDRWYAANAEHNPDLTAAEAAARATNLIEALENNERLRKLTESPLLATMLALVHLNRKTLPQDRAELYHECVELLLDRWEPERSWANRLPSLLERLAIPGLRREDLRAVLHALAYQAHLSPPSADGRGLISDDQLQGQLLKFFLAIKVPPAEVLNKHRIFLAALREETGLLHDLDGVYALPHLTFEEYLAACHLADQAAMRDLAYERWAGADRERWREVLLLMMGRLRQQGKTARDGADWVRHLGKKRPGGRAKPAKPAKQRQRDALFAAECYAEMGGAAALLNSSEDIDEIEERLADGLAEILDTAPSILPLPERIRAGELLGPLGDPRLLDPELGNSRDGKYWCAVEAGDFWFDMTPLAISPLQKIKLDYGFKIARFPVTNVEYRRFIDAGGYEDNQWWTPEGWSWKIQQSSFPLVTEELEATKNSFPVVSVSWYEAKAFCTWITNQGYAAGWLEQGYEIRLLTYIEWERSARHTDKRLYPWGNEKTGPEHVNTLDFHDGEPTPVGCFIAGRAECGALDLLGNTETWLATPAGTIDSIQPLNDIPQSEQVFVKQDDFFNYGIHQISDVLFQLHPNEQTAITGFRLVMAPRDLSEG